MIHNFLKRPISIFFLLCISLTLIVGCNGSSDPDPTATQESIPTDLPKEPTDTPDDETDDTDDATGSQWNIDPFEHLRVTELGGDQAIPKVVGASNGDFYVAWFSNPDAQNYNVRLQRFDAGGNAQWEENGIVISDHPSRSWIADFILTIDDEDNAIVIFQDVRTGSSNMFVYKTSPSGEFLWGEDGIALSNNEFNEIPAPMALLTPDSLTVGWLRSDDSGTPSALVLQKLSVDGTPLWADDGVEVIDRAATLPIMVSSDGDQTIVAYGVEVESTQVTSLYVQKVDGDGNAVWSEPTLLSEEMPIYILPSIVSDERGGAFVGWHTINLESYVQHIDGDGNASWTKAGARVADSGANKQFNPIINYDAETQELFAFWTETDPGQTVGGVYGQKLSADGTWLWADGGVKIVEPHPEPLTSLTVRPMDENFALFYLQGGVMGDALVLAQRIDRDGNVIDVNPAGISYTQGNKQAMSVAEIGEQHWVAVWSAGMAESEEGTDLYIQDVSMATFE